MATAATAQAGELPRIGRRKFLYYFGPAFVASIAYIDPGNFAANFEGGTRFGFWNLVKPAEHEEVDWWGSLGGLEGDF